MPDPETSPESAPRWRDLIELLRPVRTLLVAASVLQGLAAAASIVPLVCVVEIARRLLAAGAPDEDAIRALVVVAVAAFSFRLMAQGISSQVTHLADNTFQLEVRRRVTARLGRLPLGWFGARNSGEVKRAVQDDVAAMHYLVAHSLPDLVAGVVAPVLALGYLVTIDWRLTLVTLAPLVVFACFYGSIVRGYSSQMAGHAAALGRINGAVVEFVQGIAVVKAFGRSHRAHERFARSADEFADFHDAWVAPIARRSALGELACSPPVMLLVILAGGTALVAGGGMEPVDVVPFALLGLGLTAPLLTLGYSAQGFRLAAEAGSRVAALLAIPELPQPSAAAADPVPQQPPAAAAAAVPRAAADPASRSPAAAAADAMPRSAAAPAAAADAPLRLAAAAADASPRAAAAAAIAFDDVSFTYDGRTEVLRAITADLEPGTVTALVGPSGAGKSTLATLIPRFWDVSAGAVRVGGADVRDMAADDLYARVAFVFQEPGLLRATVRDNIRLGRPGAPHADVVAAARAAQIHDRITALERGYDAVIGDDAKLSGGEAQRVAIARALLADRPILVLDEATAFADPESEAAIQDALSELARGRTIVVIAHRLSTIASADRILVLDKGEVVERGRHDELVAAGGLYARMWAAHERATGATA